MLDRLKYILLALLLLISAGFAFAQSSTNPNYQTPQQRANFGRDTSSTTTTKRLTGDQEIDEERKKDEKRRDSVLFTSKFIRVTNEHLLNDSTQVFPLDTGLTNFENYSPLYQPRSPKTGLGNLGLAERNLLFEPSKTIGFDVGQHFLDAYLFTPQDVLYYKARVPYTNLSLYTSGVKEQYFKVIHTQNINPQLNVGFNLNFIGSHGIYTRQAAGDFTGGLFSWYESKNKRYNLLVNYTFNNLKAPENGSIQNDSVFTSPAGAYSTSQNEPVRLYNSSDNIRINGFYIKQFYYLGKIDSLAKGADKSKVLPTQRVSYTFNYNTSTYKFLQNEPDTYNVFPDYYYSSTYSRDSLRVAHIQSGFAYSFYLRGKSTGVIKNEVKLDIGLTQDFYHYQQFVSDSVTNAATFGRTLQTDKKQDKSFQDITLKAKAGYRFSNKILLDVDLQQIAAGRDFGDFLYQANLTLSGGNKAGKIMLGAYSQSSSPPLVYTDWVSNHYIFHNNFGNQKTTSLSFNYINNPLQLDIKAEYFLVTDYLYFTAQPNGIDATPTQLNAPINLLKVSVGKNLIWHRWHFDNYVVYQKTDYQSTLRTPEVYTYSSLYYAKLLFNVLNSNIGVNVRYNTPYVAPSYAVGLGQFYNNSPNLTFSSYPVASVFFKATLIRTNIFVMYDYANKGLLSQGYYTVNRYPMPGSMLKFGVSWSFYN